MTVARAFPYLRYDPDVVGDPGNLLAPPYDVVDVEQVAALAARSPYQSTLVESPEGADTKLAAQRLTQWIDDGALEEGEVGFAVIKQRYVGPDGVRRTRTGVLAELRLAPFGAGEVLPHEQTFEAPRKLRQQLMEDAGANISPVFVLYHDPGQSLTDLLASVTDDEPDFTAVEADDVQTAVWFVTDVSLCERLERLTDEQQFLIADGHHRYTAALAHRDAARAASPMAAVGGPSGLAPHTDSSGVDGVLAFVANSADEGIMVFPTHRLVHGVDAKLVDTFAVESGALQIVEANSLDAALAQLDASSVPGFVAYQDGRAKTYLAHDPTDLEIALPGVSEAQRSLDVTVLHALVLDGGAVLLDRADGISYTRSLADAIAAADADPRTIAFILREAPVATVHAVAAAHELLPQKSTYFYPKVPTGVVFRRL